MNLESSIVEFKEDISKKSNGKSMKAEIVSFLNSSTGGEIFLGMDDNGDDVLYPSPESKRTKYKEWEELLTNWISEAFSPSVREFVQLEIDVKFKIIINPGTNQPYYFKNGTGFNAQGIYIRTGSTKRLASDEEVRRMMLLHNQDSYDSELCSFSELSFMDVENKFNQKNISFDPIPLSIWNIKKNMYTNAAFIVSDQNTFGSKVARFKGINIDSFIDKKEFNGSIINQIDQMLNYLNLVNNVNVIITGSPQRITLMDYPVEAIREAIINAFCHRSYTHTSDVKIEVFDDRIFIQSPGGIPDGLAIADIKKGANSKRNPTLIGILDKIGYIENYGTGIRRIINSYQNFKREPLFEMSENQFSVTLYNRNYYLNKIDLNQKMREIMEFLSDGKMVSRLDIEQKIELKKSQTQALIKELRENKLILIEGVGPSTKYSIAKK